MIAPGMIAPLVPVLIRGIRAADLEELSQELAEQLRDYLPEPTDQARVARLCGLVSFHLAPGDRAPFPGG